VRDKMKKLYIIIIIFFILILSGCSFNESIKLSDINDYDEYLTNVKTSREFMPDSSNLERYESISVIYYLDRPDTIHTHTINLIITYSKEDYNHAKSIYLSDYSYLEAPLYDPDDKKWTLISDAEVEFNNYLIKVVDDENFNYPKYFGMIGFNEEEHKISFMYSHNLSKNYLYKYTLIEFIEDSYKFE